MRAAAYMAAALAAINTLLDAILSGPAFVPEGLLWVSAVVIVCTVLDLEGRDEQQEKIRAYVDSLKNELNERLDGHDQHALLHLLGSVSARPRSGPSGH